MKSHLPDPLLHPGLLSECNILSKLLTSEMNQDPGCIPLLQGSLLGVSTSKVVTTIRASWYECTIDLLELGEYKINRDPFYSRGRSDYGYSDSHEKS